jgi:hypothetical protein
MFEGLRESMTIAHKLKPVQIVLPAAQARDLAQQLAAVLPPGG